MILTTARDQLQHFVSGLVSTGVSAWQSIGWWGTMFPTSMQPWWNQAVWDTCGCCSDNITNNKFFGLVNAIFGYQVCQIDLGKLPVPSMIARLPG